MVDIDDTVIEVYGYTKQGSGYGYSGIRGLNALLATVTTRHTAPLVVAQRLAERVVRFTTGREVVSRRHLGKGRLLMSDKRSLSDLSRAGRV